MKFCCIHVWIYQGINLKTLKFVFCVSLLPHTSFVNTVILFSWASCQSSRRSYKAHKYDTLLPVEGICHACFSFCPQVLWLGHSMGGHLVPPLSMSMGAHGMLKLVGAFLPLIEISSVNRWAIPQPRQPALFLCILNGFFLEITVSLSEKPSSRRKAEFPFLCRRTHHLFCASSLKQDST